MKFHLLFIVILFAVVTISCEKVIDVDLNEAEPRIVIEGKVSDAQRIVEVRLTKTSNYFESSLHYTPVQNGHVILKRGFIQELLAENEPGVFRGGVIFPYGVYELQVTAEGKTYTATSRMPIPVTLDSIPTGKAIDFRTDSGYNVTVVFDDPVNEKNYYRIVPHVNSFPSDSVLSQFQRFLVFEDRLINGNHVRLEVRLRRNIRAGDTLYVDLWSIDKPAYDYFNTLSDIVSSDRGPTAAAPSNPTTNISNGALGYFSAYSVSRKVKILR